MKLLKGVVNFLSGKKTFIIAILMLILGILQDDNKLILESLGLASLRLGIAKK